MFVIPISIAFSLVQVLALIALVRILGPEEYGEYSFAYSIAIFVAALSSEWIRLLIARYSAIRAQRLRATLIKTAGYWLLTLASTSMLLGILLVFALRMFNTPQWIGALATALILASSSIAGDGASTFVRFNLSNRTYLNYVILRTTLSSASLIITGYLTKSAVLSALSFAIAIWVVAFLFSRRHVFSLEAKLRHGRLFSLSGRGWSMAAGAITSNGSLAIARIAIKAATPADVSGAIFLAIDLMGRGTNVLGSALNTWSAKLLYASSHRKSLAEGGSVIPKTSALFAGVWGTIGILGAAASVAAPLIILGPNAFGEETLIAGSNVVAILALTARVFNVDVILNTKNKYGLVLTSSIITLSVVTLSSLFKSTAPFSLPIAIACSYAFVLCMREKDADVFPAIIDVLTITFLSSLAVYTCFSSASGAGIYTYPQLILCAGLSLAWGGLQIARWRKLKD